MPCSHCWIAERVRTVANTTTETTLWTNTQPANSLIAGNIFKVELLGKASNVGPTDDLTIRVKVGGVTKVTITNSARTFTDDDVHIKGVATQRTIGATGSRAQDFHLDIGGDTSSMQGVGTIDTTADMSISITAQWNNAKTGNTITVYQAFMEYKN